MEEFKDKIEHKDDERELIICEGESASPVGTIRIVGQGRKAITMKEVLEAIDKDIFDKFMMNIETIEECHQDNMKILMTENTKERIITYAANISANIDEYLSYVLILNGFRDNDMVLGIPSRQDFFDGDILSQIHVDDNKLLYEKEFRTHHCGKYTKKRKYKNKNKRRK